MKTNDLIWKGFILYFFMVVIISAAIMVGKSIEIVYVGQTYGWFFMGLSVLEVIAVYFMYRCEFYKNGYFDDKSVKYLTGYYLWLKLIRKWRNRKSCLQKTA